MRLSTYSWETGTYVTNGTFTDFKVVLTFGLTPSVEREGNVLVVKVPIPMQTKAGDENGEGVEYSYQGISFTETLENWKWIWVLFSAALLHGSFHKDQTSFETYRRWSTGKQHKKALDTISFIEDVRITLLGLQKNPGFGSTIGYANYVSLSTAPDEERKILIDVWGTPDNKILNMIKSGDLVGALNAVYEYPVVPRLIYADARGVDIRMKKWADTHDDPDLRRNVLKVVGIDLNNEWNKTIAADSLDFAVSIRSFYHTKEAVKEKFVEALEGTVLEGIDFPVSDYAEYLKTRASLAGPIRSIRNRLVLLKNEEDEVTHQRAGYPDLPEVIQMLASGKERENVFVRNELERTDLAWVILADTSKSMGSGINTVKGVITCLSEVAKDLIPHYDDWAVYTFDTGLKVIKDFSEPYSNDSRARIGGLVPTSLTYFPDALMAVSKMLAKRSAALKILVVVSDGEPLGYIGIKEKMTATMKQLLKTPIIMLGVGVQSAEMKKYFRATVKIDNPYEMMKFFVNKYIEIVANA